MAILTPDVSEMTDFDASRPNTYLATIKSVEIVESKEPNKHTGKKTPGIRPTFEFRAPRNDNGEERPVTRTSWLSTAGKGTFGFDQLLRCVGLGDVADEMKARPGTVPFDTDVLLEKQVTLVLVNEPYTKPGQAERIQDVIQSFLPA